MKTLCELLAPKGFTRDGNQLEMFVPTLVELPWRGQSTRVLTRVFSMFSVGTPPPRGLRD